MKDNISDEEIDFYNLSAEHKISSLHVQSYVQEQNTNPKVKSRRKRQGIGSLPNVRR